jgi:hypothetical protein
MAAGRTLNRTSGRTNPRRGGGRLCAPGGRQRRGSAGSILPIESNPNRPTVGELLMKRPWPRMLPPAQGKGESPGYLPGLSSRHNYGKPGERRRTDHLGPPSRRRLRCLAARHSTLALPGANRRAARGRLSNCRRLVTLQTRRVCGAAIARPTALSRDGTRDAAACNVADSKATTPGRAVGARHKSGFLLMYASNYWRRSMPASHSEP